MGLLDQMLGGMAGGVKRPQTKPGMGQTLAAGVLLALLVKAARQHQAGAGTGAAQHAPQIQSQGGGPLGGLGGLGAMLGGAGAGGGLGSLLSGLGGAGALGGLLGHMQQRGLTNQVNSWVGTGQNQTVDPHQLEQALGEETLQELQQQTGLPRQHLLAQLATELPEAINEATPQGRVPEDHELETIAAQPPVSH